MRPRRILLGPAAEARQLSEPADGGPAANFRLAQPEAGEVEDAERDLFRKVAVEEPADRAGFGRGWGGLDELSGGGGLSLERVNIDLERAGRKLRLTFVTRNH